MQTQNFPDSSAVPRCRCHFVHLSVLTTSSGRLSRDGSSKMRQLLRMNACTSRRFARWPKTGQCKKCTCKTKEGQHFVPTPSDRSETYFDVPLSNNCHKSILHQLFGNESSWRGNVLGVPQPLEVFNRRVDIQVYLTSRVCFVLSFLERQSPTRLWFAIQGQRQPTIGAHCAHWW